MIDGKSNLIPSATLIADWLSDVPEKDQLREEIELMLALLGLAL
jgi:hypothetical protein